jgi:hypothetical protein
MNRESLRHITRVEEIMSIMDTYEHEGEVRGHVKRV